ncbi:hypothetical protein ACQP60_08615 [Isoptericola variabilis]|uniref:hypothetical protein n=1 Tax=Isoptericola variabilis TaxID=139208 RepID=UPI003D220CAD
MTTTETTMDKAICTVCGEVLDRLARLIGKGYHEHCESAAQAMRKSEAAERLVEFLRTSKRATGNGITTNVKGKRAWLLGVVGELVDAGVVRREDGPRGAFVHHLTDDHAERFEQWRAAVLAVVPDPHHLEAQPHLEVEPVSDDGAKPSDLARFLQACGYRDGDRVALCTMPPGEAFNVTWVTPAELLARDLSDQADTWLSVNAFRAGVTSRTSANVSGVIAFPADLDVGGTGKHLPTWEAAHAVKDEVSGRLGGAQPAVVVFSGHGLQPRWRVDDGGDVARAQALGRAFARLVAGVAERHGGTVDTVSDAARVMRVPGTWNVGKGEPMAVMLLDAVEPDETDVLTLDDVEDRLTAAGVRVVAEDHDAVGEVVTPPSKWPEGLAKPCRYVARMIDAWATDTPPGRHPWLLSQMIRLACARRLGCLNDDTWAEAQRTLVARFAWLLENTEPRRAPALGEVAGAADYAVRKASEKTEDEAAGELGKHLPHGPGPDDEALMAGLMATNPPTVPALADVTAGAVDRPGDAGEADELFWTARPELDHIRQAARARRAGPWAVLSIVLARVVALIPPSVVLPDQLGDHASLNLMAVIVAPSGGGKGAANGVARRLLPLPAPEFEQPIGSGEGLVKSLTEKYRDMDTDGKPVGPSQRRPHGLGRLVNVAEVDALVAVGMDRRGATIMAMLRSVFSGEQLGFMNADDERRIVVNDHGYRVCLVIGAQPARCGPILNDADGGTPQRLAWMPAKDPGAPDVQPAWPGPLGWRVPALPPLPPYDPAAAGRRPMTVPPSVQDEIDAVRLPVVRGDADVDPLASHRALVRLKYAAALALLAGRVDVREDDWALAGHILRVSNVTLQDVLAVQAREVAKKGEAHARQHARNAVAVEDAKANRDRKRVAARVLKIVTAAASAGITGGPLKRQLPGRDRYLVDEVVESLVSLGQIEAAETTNKGARGVRYWAAGREGLRWPP